jgi:transposase
MTLSGVHVTVAMGLLAAIGDITRFASSEKLVSYFGLNPSVRQSGNGAAHHGRITKQGRSHARAMLVEATVVVQTCGTRTSVSDSRRCLQAPRIAFQIPGADPL